MTRLLTALVLVVATGTVGARMNVSPAPDARETELSRKLRRMATEAPITVGHRGAAATHPENTLPSFHAAVEAGAQMVELDFRATRDGRLVCMHDATLDRTTDATRRIADGGRTRIAIDGVDFADLEQLDAGSWKHARFAGTTVPTLGQALDLIQRGSITMVEHKAGDPRRLVELLRSKDLVDSVLVQSFDWDWLERVHALEPALTIGALGSRALTAERLDDVKRTGASMIHWDADDLRVEDVAALRERGYLICVYTVNSDIGLLGAAAIGVDAITTDVPARLGSLVASGRVTRR